MENGEYIALVPKNASLSLSRTFSCLTLILALTLEKSIRRSLQVLELVSIRSLIGCHQLKLRHSAFLHGGRSVSSNCYVYNKAG